MVSASITSEQLIQQIPIDAELRLEQIEPKFFRILNQFSPFWAGEYGAGVHQQKMCMLGAIRQLWALPFKNDGYAAGIATF